MFAAVDPLLETLDPIRRPGAARPRWHRIIRIQQSCQNLISVISNSSVIAEIYAEVIHVVNVLVGELRANVVLKARASAHSIWLRAHSLILVSLKVIDQFEHQLFGSWIQLAILRHVVLIYSADDALLFLKNNLLLEDMEPDRAVAAKTILIH